MPSRFLLVKERDIAEHIQTTLKEIAERAEAVLGPSVTVRRSERGGEHRIEVVKPLTHELLLFLVSVRRPSIERIEIIAHADGLEDIVEESVVRLRFALGAHEHILLTLWFLP